ncbi:nuclear pore complex protein Nup85 [Ceratina calcarata]|uniref:Nuclear pore complex protein Nup85 n=1 Tax=Ceratina calcarata TaxID=156304 RepID=A0AAJ7J5Z0_9HYME|nr:nuclear pore complex protein Nup85 [Ceratina calcarata]XP_026672254.1 nuclear pore complex protein Nup85 [Ceratina calcarata]XP_026672255.1 nuclear pore complex protein Nup85 [Ceratina calcarata]
MDGVDGPPVVELGNVSKTTRLIGTWLSTNRLSIHQNETKKLPNKMPDSTVTILRPEVILFSPHLRKLVNESNGVFLSVRKIDSTNTGDVRSELLKHSKRYRSILRACIESLQDSRDSCLPETRESVENFLTIFYQVEWVWHLTEILYVDTLPGDVVLPQLLEWISFHFPSKEMAAAKILSRKTIGAELEHQNYWEAAIGCAMHGKLDLLRGLLALHSKADHPAFVAADGILKLMPVYNVYGGYSVNEFVVRWKHWQMDLMSNLNGKLFAVDGELEIVIKLISGHQETLCQLADHTDAWYELLAAKLLYNSPCCKQPELCRHVDSFSNIWYKDRSPSDKAILALMETNLSVAIKEIQSMGDNGWFAAHLVDLLYTCGRLSILDKDQLEVSSQLHESLILEYGSTLTSHHSLWQCGISYLTHCPTQGLARLEILLQSLPMGCEARVNKILDVARDNKLDHIVTSICKIQSTNSMKRGRLGNALAWALKAKDGGFVTYIADQFLKHYAEHGKLECKDLLENLGFCMMASDRLTFLGKYCEFHQMYGIGEFKEAASLLVSLLVSNLTPKYFWSILLLDAIPLLEAKEVIFSSGDCFELLRCVEAHGDSPKLKEELDTFRFAVARNLARALSLEGCQIEH